MKSTCGRLCNISSATLTLKHQWKCSFWPRCMLVVRVISVGRPDAWRHSLSNPLLFLLFPLCSVKRLQFLTAVWVGRLLSLIFLIKSTPAWKSFVLPVMLSSSTGTAKYLLGFIPVHFKRSWIIFGWVYISRTSDVYWYTVLAIESTVKSICLMILLMCIVKLRFVES